MNCISLWQYWASAMAVGLKHNETRGWPLPAHFIGKPLVIHAAKLKDEAAREDFEFFMDENPEFGSAMIRAGVRWFDDLPFGALVGVVDVHQCIRTERFTLVPERVVDMGKTFISNQEFVLGNYNEGRWAWVTKNPRRFAKPIPWKGKQGFFTVPDEIVADSLKARAA